MTEISTQPLTADAFAPFGQVMEAVGEADKIINQGMCDRFHDRAEIITRGGRTGISIFDAKPRQLPYYLDMVEKHPLGSQAFLPMHQNPYLVIAAPDKAGKPDVPLAFIASPGQCINFYAGTWHGVLTPLHHPGLFAVVDRIADDANLVEHWFDAPYVIR